MATAVQTKSKIQIPYNFQPYYWQVPSFNMLENGYKRGIWVDHRRCGKDIRCINLIIKQMYQEPGLYFLVYPTLKQGRMILWEGYTDEGKTFLETYLPQGLLASKPNSTDMKFRIYSRNGDISMLQVVGTENNRYEAMRGTNPRGIIFSEYSRQHPGAWDVVRPILLKNGGWAIFQSTPNGNNHFKDLWDITAKNNRWFRCLHTVKDTYDHEGYRLISLADIEEELATGQTEDFVQQEYYCSFSQGIEGTYVGKLIQELEDNERIEDLPYDPTYLVNTYWDLGIRKDSMSVWFVQQVGQEIRFIDFEEATAKTFTYWAKVLQDKPYLYGKHFAPHDIQHREMIGAEDAAKSRLAHAKDVGILFNKTPFASFENGVEALRGLLGLCRFDQTKCKAGLDHLRKWGKKYNKLEQRYTETENDNEHSHAGAAARYAAINIRQAQGFDVLKTREEKHFKNVFRRKRSYGSAMSV